MAITITELGPTSPSNTSCGCEIYYENETLTNILTSIENYVTSTNPNRGWTKDTANSTSTSLAIVSPTVITSQNKYVKINISGSSLILTSYEVNYQNATSDTLIINFGSSSGLSGAIYVFAHPRWLLIGIDPSTLGGCMEVLPEFISNPSTSFWGTWLLSASFSKFSLCRDWCNQTGGTVTANSFTLNNFTGIIGNISPGHTDPNYERVFGFTFLSGGTVSFTTDSGQSYSIAASWSYYKYIPGINHTNGKYLVSSIRVGTWNGNTTNGGIIGRVAGLKSIPSANSHMSTLLLKIDDNGLLSSSGTDKLHLIWSASVPSRNVTFPIQL